MSSILSKLISIYIHRPQYIHRPKSETPNQTSINAWPFANVLPLEPIRKVLGDGTAIECLPTFLIAS
jgi:hypothetical protein